MAMSYEVLTNYTKARKFYYGGGVIGTPGEEKLDALTHSHTHSLTLPIICKYERLY